jgi:hypothetical protein
MISNHTTKIVFVITTVNHPTRAVRELSEHLLKVGSRSIGVLDAKFVVVGDKKTPLNWSCPPAHFFSAEEQGKSRYRLSMSLPWNSYCRKMLGYLEAIRMRAEWIKEFDDDNIVKPSFLKVPDLEVEARMVSSNSSPWINLYSAFTSRKIWPRGLPLEVLFETFSKPAKFTNKLSKVKDVVIHQSLADGEPDVDAVYRLVVDPESNITFDKNFSVLVPKQFITPFNSQATTWHHKVFPLMYLPTTCSWRMTDIWRSFIVQRIIRDSEMNIVFTAAEVFQIRNQHSLLRDFKEEIEGYVGNEEIRSVLDGLNLIGGPESFEADMITIYKKLVATKFLEPEELISLSDWFKDVNNAQLNPYDE